MKVVCLLSKCSPDFLAAGESAVSVARAYLSCGPPTIARAEVELVAPVTRMDKVMVVMMMECNDDDDGGR